MHGAEIIFFLGLGAGIFMSPALGVVLCVVAVVMMREAA